MSNTFNLTPSSLPSVSDDEWPYLLNHPTWQPLTNILNPTAQITFQKIHGPPNPNNPLPDSQTVKLTPLPQKSVTIRVCCTVCVEFEKTRKFADASTKFLRFCTFCFLLFYPLSIPIESIPLLFPLLYFIYLFNWFGDEICQLSLFGCWENEGKELQIQAEFGEVWCGGARVAARILFFHFLSKQTGWGRIQECRGDRTVWRGRSEGWIQVLLRKTSLKGNDLLWLGILFLHSRLFNLCF